MTLIGVEKVLWVTFPESEKEKVTQAMDESINELLTIKKFADDFKEGRIDRKDMKKRLSEMEGMSLFDKTKAKMFINASAYIHKFKDGKIAKRIPLIKNVLEMMEGFMLMNISYEYRHTSTISGISIVLTQVGAERVNYTQLLEKLFHKYRVNDYTIYKNQEESKL